MNSIILIGVVAFLAIAIIFSVIYKKSVIDSQIEKLNDLEDEVQKAKIKAKEILEEAEKDALLGPCKVVWPHHYLDFRLPGCGAGRHFLPCDSMTFYSHLPQQL